MKRVKNKTRTRAESASNHQRVFLLSFFFFLLPFLSNKKKFGDSAFLYLTHKHAPYSLFFPFRTRLIKQHWPIKSTQLSVYTVWLIYIDETKCVSIFCPDWDIKKRRIIHIGWTIIIITKLYCGVYTKPKSNFSFYYSCCYCVSHIC